MKINRAWLAAAGVAAIGASAFAQPATGLFKWEVSADGGGTWQSDIVLGASDPYKVRAVASWTDGATPSIGFAGATFEQIDIVGAALGDTFGGAMNPGDVPTYVKRLQGTPETWTLQAGSGASFGALKIDNGVTTARTNFGQLPKTLPGGVPNPNFSAANPLVVFEMDCVTGVSDHDITFSGAWTRLGTPASNEFKVYTTETGTNKKPAAEATQMSATVHIIIPAPASAAVLVGGLAAFRRRR